MGKPIRHRWVNNHNILPVQKPSTFSVYFPWFIRIFVVESRVVPPLDRNFFHMVLAIDKNTPELIKIVGAGKSAAYADDCNIVGTHAEVMIKRNIHVEQRLALKAPNTTKAAFANIIEPDETAHKELLYAI